MALLQLNVFFLWYVFCFFKPLVTPIPSCYTKEDQALCETHDRDNRGGKTDERVTGKDDREGEGWWDGKKQKARLYGTGRYASTFFIRASCAIVFQMGNGVTDGGAAESHRNNHVSSVQQHALFSEADSNPKSTYCFQQYCKIQTKNQF